LDRSAAGWIEQEAKRRGIPIEEVARRLIYRGLAAETDSAAPTLYHDLDNLAGTWAREEVEELGNSVMAMDQVDSSLWK
jgi:hypothetical protein